jgi:hypothetical protein
MLVLFLFAIASGCAGGHPQPETLMKLDHEQTLQWIREHRAWRLAKKTKPIWARPVESDEAGKEFMTADHTAQQAREGFWLCVGVAGEPWFQDLNRIERNYEPAEQEMKRFSFDDRQHRYRVYRPKEDTQKWVAQIKGPGIEGFFIKPNYDPSRPLYSPAGGYVVKDPVRDPYLEGADVWLVQEGLFESTYELLP